MGTRCASASHLLGPLRWKPAALFPPEVADGPGGPGPPIGFQETAERAWKPPGRPLAPKTGAPSGYGALIFPAARKIYREIGATPAALARARLHAAAAIDLARPTGHFARMQPDRPPRPRGFALPIYQGRSRCPDEPMPEDRGACPAPFNLLSPHSNGRPANPGCGPLLSGIRHGPRGLSAAGMWGNPELQAA